MNHQESPLKPEANIGTKDVTEIYNLLEENGIQVYIDGGWGIDALIGE